MTYDEIAVARSIIGGAIFLYMNLNIPQKQNFFVVLRTNEYWLIIDPTGMDNEVSALCTFHFFIFLETREFIEIILIGNYTCSRRINEKSHLFAGIIHDW